MSIKILNEEEVTEEVINNLRKVSEIFEAFRQAFGKTDPVNYGEVVKMSEEGQELISLIMDDVIPLSMAIDTISWERIVKLRPPHDNCQSCTCVVIDDAFN